MNSNELTISAFAETDRRALQTLYQEVRLQTFNWLNTTNAPLASFDADTVGEMVLVAKVKNEVAGFISIWLPNDFIHHLYVRDIWQGKGIGSALMDAAKAHFTGPATLKCLVSNERAILFYTKTGWASKALGSSQECDYILFERNFKQSLQ